MVVPLQAPSVKSPLGIIALFVALIELFLAYPVTQLQGLDRMLIVVFMIVFPFFVAAGFFVVLWFRPLNLYNPGELTPNLQERFPTVALVENKAWEIKTRELEQEIVRLEERTAQSELSFHAMVKKSEITERTQEALTLDIKQLSSEIRTRLQHGLALDMSDLERAKTDVIAARRLSREQKASMVQEELLKIRSWLADKGFSNLPEIPKVKILSANSILSGMSHGMLEIGESIIEDLDYIAFVYLDWIFRFRGHEKDSSELKDETKSVLFGFIDDYVASYKDSLRLKEVTERVLGLKAYASNLEEVVKFDPHKPRLVSKICAGACWELRGLLGGERVDPAIGSTMQKLKPDTTLKEAFEILRDELELRAGRQASELVARVAEKRGVALKN